MGIYTNYTGGYGVSSNYTEVEPFVGESFNYHELGILAASEIAANHNSFMKSIALAELAAVEQTGDTDVLYESVNIKGFFEKVKMFFKKIIEKIHKIFHTFIAKMTSWFGNNKDFVKKYRTEITKGWSNVKEDWEFKGYNYSRVMAFKVGDGSTTVKADAKALGEKLKALIEDGKLDKYVTGKNENDVAIDNEDSIDSKVSDADASHNGKRKAVDVTQELSAIREKMDNIKDDIRSQFVNQVKAGKLEKVEIKKDASGGYDATEFSEELFKALRNDEDSKVDMKKKDIETAYTSLANMLAYVETFEKTKTGLESAEKSIVKGIDDIIKKIDTQSNKLLSEHKDGSKDGIVQAGSLYQTIWGFIQECVTQTFSAVLQAAKDNCAQAKEIAVKVIGQSKKMTEESYDYSNSDNTGYDFISSVKLV